MKIIKDKYAFIYNEIKHINSKFYISKYYLDTKIADFYPLSFSIDDVFAFQISTPILFFRTLKEIAEIYKTNNDKKERR
jgi:hypothetical protein